MRPSVRVGVLAAAGLAAFYVAVLASASGWDHLRSQARQDWYFLVPLIAGFGSQVGLLHELRVRRAAHHMQAVAGGGAGASAAGMVACCAHHLADLVPLIGVSGAATFLTTWRVEFMLVGLAVNAVGIATSLRRLHAFRLTQEPRWHAA